MSDDYKAEFLQARGYLRVAVRLMQTADPMDMASEAAFTTVDAACTKAAEAINALDSAQQDVETGVLVLFELVRFYGWRITNYIAAQGHYTPFSEQESEDLRTALELVIGDPKEAVKATGIADVPMDSAIEANLVQATDDKRQEAAFKFFLELWRLCVHPGLQLREKD